MRRRSATANRYVQSLRVNGQPWNKLTLPHALLAQGATLEFTMGPQTFALGQRRSGAAAVADRTRQAATAARFTDGAQGDSPARRPSPTCRRCSTTTAAPKPRCPRRRPRSAGTSRSRAGSRMLTLTSGASGRRTVGLATAGLRRRQALAHAGHPPARAFRMAAADPRVRRARARRVRVLPVALRRGDGCVDARTRRNRTARRSASVRGVVRRPRHGRALDLFRPPQPFVTIARWRIQHAMLMRSRVAGSTSCSNCAERNSSRVPACG